MKTAISVVVGVSVVVLTGCVSPEPAPVITAEQIRASLQSEKAQLAASEEQEKSGRFYSQKLTIGINEDRNMRAVKDVTFDLDFGSQSGLGDAKDVRLEVNKSETLVIDDGTGNPIVMAVPVGFSLGMGSLSSASLDHVPAETQARASLALARGQAGTEVIGAIYKGYVEFVNAAGEVSVKRTRLDRDWETN